MKVPSMKCDKKDLLLYAVTDRSWLNGRALDEDVATVLENGATFLQIREKELDSASFLAEAKKLKELAGRFHVPFVVNDSVEIALACGADGVHVGQSDIRGRDIRAMIGPDKILGISAGTVEEAVAAERAGADYIGVGAVFDTSTKKITRAMGVEELRSISRSVSIPVVAIGGINAGNILQLSGSGVDGVAVVSAIFGAEDPGRATSELRKLSAQMVAAHG